MPKCADVQLQFGSDNLLQDIKDVAFFRKLQRLGSYTFGKALNNAMKQGGLPEIDAWICPSAVLARPLEAHERRHRHPEFDVWIVVDTVAKTWRREREILAGTKFWLLVLCLDQCSVGRSWTFHAKLQMRLFFSQFGTCITGCGTTFELECWQPKAKIPSFCVQRLQCMLRPLEHGRQFRYKEGLVRRLVVRFLCIFTMVLGQSARVGA